MSFLSYLQPLLNYRNVMTLQFSAIYWPSFVNFQPHGVNGDLKPSALFWTQRPLKSFLDFWSEFVSLLHLLPILPTNQRQRLVPLWFYSNMLHYPTTPLSVHSGFYPHWLRKVRTKIYAQTHSRFRKVNDVLLLSNSFAALEAYLSVSHKQRTKE